MDAADLPLDRLSHDGIEPARRGGVLVVACGALAREIVTLRSLNGWSHLDIACLPAILHNTPDAIPAAVRAAVERHGPHYDSIFVAYADCGTGGRLRAVCDDLGVGMIEGPHCYAFFDGLDAFAARAEAEMGAFYLTDFLTRQFETFVIRPLGLDRHPELRDMYFGNYDRLIYLAQTEDPGLTEAARAAADRLGLSFHRRFTGYGDLGAALGRAARE